MIVEKGYQVTVAGQKRKVMIDADDTIIRTGYITGETLNQVFTHQAWACVIVVIGG
ncbi:MAG: hypothetical protein LC660_05955 [Desulfobacteraceae bacterium]|nr:hypothetical protein [Desulfobacteraceae bacterium]